MKKTINQNVFIMYTDTKQGENFCDVFDSKKKRDAALVEYLKTCEVETIEDLWELDTYVHLFDSEIQ